MKVTTRTALDIAHFLTNWMLFLYHFFHAENSTCSAVVAGLPHYITQHGNYRQLVFKYEPWICVEHYE